MKIVIAGAGAVGFHLAELLARENQDIIVIDTDLNALESMSSQIDVMTVKGDATSTVVLEQVDISSADIYLGVSTSEKTNLLSAIIASQLGAKTTIARVNSPEYLEPKQRENFKKLGVDQLFSPQQLAAEEIERLLKRSSFTDIYSFEEGKISVVGLTIDTGSSLEGITFDQLDSLYTGFYCRGIAVLRNHKTVIPTGSTKIQRGDHIYLAVQNESLDQATLFAGKRLKEIEHVMIVGGTEMALRTAKILEEKYKVKLIVEDKEIGKRFLETLHESLVIVADIDNRQALNKEGLANMDAFIALTPNSETNIITSLMAEESGVYKTIALVDNVNYTHISQNIGVDTIINKKLIAANEIFRFVRKGRIEAIATLHGVDAEVIEFVIYKKNRILNNPVSKLKMPAKSIIAGVIRGNDGFIPDKDFIFQLDDKVIVFALPEAINRVEKIFK